MFLQDFIIERNVKQSAVSMYLKRHEKDFDGHTSMRDGKLWLDDVALELLSKKYPVVPPDNVWTPQAKQAYDELQEELRDANKEIRQLNAENRELRTYELQYRALETQQRQLIETAVTEKQAELQRQHENAENKLKEHFKEELDRKEEENRKLLEALAIEKAKKWKFPWSK